MTRERKQREQKFDLSAGILCLDFANTVTKRNQPGRSHDELASYARLVAFAKQAGVISPARAKLLNQRATLSVRVADRVLKSAAVLREAIYRVFSSIVAGQPAASKDLKLLNGFAIEAWRHRCLTQAPPGQYGWQWATEDADSFAQILWPIALSAVDLLTSDRLSAVRECAADDCAWLFLDESRNRSRRWCDMKVCGNRQKARLHYHRSQK